MIDIKLIRENPDLGKDADRKKNMKVDIDQVLAVDTRRRALETEFNELRNRQNKAGERMAKASKEEREAIKAEMGPIKSRLAEIETEKGTVDAELYQLMLLVPQIPDPAAPIGKSDADNVEVRRVGTPRKKGDFGFPFKDHVELGT